ncbi:PQQ-dependent sugar dehydrogenase [Blastococcus capsensis]|uniref:PQQ-dependent sugar dehydrogenase n=1 Tax=Blastococcus capsensis TaxID=1564163 RepID=UPI002540BEE4|nr:PQQ-dependent sugar dehydrogenase [Blastococcus capsensis]MDK3257684.1 PQQ-dependent sugar dehydrogenase [Blastococcus capsensis]
MRPTRALRAPRVVAALLAGLLLTACADTGYEPAGPFRPLPEGAPPEVGPPPATVPAPVDPAQPGSGEQEGDPNVVASGLSVPTGLVVLPDGSAIVGERDTGRLLQVFPDRSPATELMTVPGIDTSGDGGLLGLTLSPTFAEDGLLFAYISTATDNRVVRFPIGGTPNPVFTGIPRGEVGNGGGLLTGADGHLYVGTGHAGNPALAADPASLAGKVLRIDVFGRPVGGSPVFSRGHRDVTALCQDEERIYATDEAGQGPDEFDVVTEGGDGAPLLDVPAEEGGLGGCAVANGTVFLGALDGRRVHVFTLDESGAPLEDVSDEVLGGSYGRLRSVALDAQGALWVTTSNRDGIGTPAEDDDKVLRIRPPGGQPQSPL